MSSNHEPITCYIVLDVASYRVLYEGQSADLAAEQLEPGTVYGFGDTHADARTNALKKLERAAGIRGKLRYVANPGEQIRASKIRQRPSRAKRQ